MSISEKIVGLRIATRKATMCEGTGGTKNTLTLKTKILFLIKDMPLMPADIINQLAIAKSNLTLIVSEMTKDGLVFKKKSGSDKREVLYAITPKGVEYLQKRLEHIESLVQRVITSTQDYLDTEAKISEALTAFEFIL